jgi:hypothetical protein
VCEKSLSSVSVGQEPVTAAEDIWKDLELYLRERALRLLSDLCYAYVKTHVPETPSDVDDSNIATAFGAAGPNCSMPLYPRALTYHRDLN